MKSSRIASAMSEGKDDAAGDGDAVADVESSSEVREAVRAGRDIVALAIGTEELVPLPVPLTVMLGVKKRVAGGEIVGEGTAVEAVGRKLQSRPEWTGIGFGWLRSLLGVREWRLPCLDVIIRL